MSGQPLRKSRANEMARNILPLTAGLNKPPLIRKYTHTVAVNEKPNARDMYSSSDVVFEGVLVESFEPALEFVDT